MKRAAVTVLNASPISLCVATRVVLIVSGAVTARMIALIILMRTVATPSQVVHHVAMMNSNVAAAIAFPKTSNVTIQMIVWTVAMKSAAVSPLKLVRATLDFNILL